jgi:hypothetical protein
LSRHQRRLGKQHLCSVALEGLPSVASCVLPCPAHSEERAPGGFRSTTQIFLSLPDLHLTLVNNSVGVPLASLAILATDFRLQQVSWSSEFRPTHDDTHRPPSLVPLHRGPIQDLLGLDLAGSLSLRAGESGDWICAFRLTCACFNRTLRPPFPSGYFNQRTYQWEPALETVRA